MSRIKVEADDGGSSEVAKRNRWATKRKAIDSALRRLASEPLSLEEARRMRGSGWDGDLEELRGRRDDAR